MAEKGYLLSEKLLKQVKKTNQAVRQIPVGGRVFEKGGPTPRTRYFAKITGRYKGSNWTVDKDIALTGVEVHFDSNNDATATVPSGRVWGVDANSESWSPIIDLTMANYAYVDNRDAGEVHIEFDTVVEVFQLVNKNREVIWVTYGAKAHEYTLDSAYNVDSTMFLDSEGTESALPDSGWPTATNNSSFVITVQTRTVYNHDSTGDNILYGYSRDFEYNAMGVLMSISPERRYIIDNPTNCA